MAYRGGKELVTVDSLPLPPGAATEETLDQRHNLFASLIKYEAQPGEELRADDITAGDRYHGRAADGASTAAAVWEVVRFYRTTTGEIIRTRYRTGVEWDSRTAGWT